MRGNPRDIRRLRAGVVPLMLGLTLLGNPILAGMGAFVWLCHGRTGRAVIAAVMVLAVPAAGILPALAMVTGLADLGAIYVAAAADSGFSTAGEFTGGCADSGFTAAVGAPTLCAVGPVGGKAHSPDEFLHLDSLVPRAQACARSILRLDRAGL